MDKLAAVHKGTLNGSGHLACTQDLLLKGAMMLVLSKTSLLQPQMEGQRCILYKAASNLAAGQ